MFLTLLSSPPAVHQLTSPERQLVHQLTLPTLISLVEPVNSFDQSQTSYEWLEVSNTSLNLKLRISTGLNWNFQQGFDWCKAIVVLNSIELDNGFVYWLTITFTTLKIVFLPLLWVKETTLQHRAPTVHINLEATWLKVLLFREQVSSPGFRNSGGADCLFKAFSLSFPILWLLCPLTYFTGVIFPLH